MEINSSAVEYIRTMVLSDHEANQRVEEKLDAHGWGDFAKLLGAVFFLAVERRFGDSAPPSGVIEFVAEARAASPVDPDLIDANAAEKLIHAALEPGRGHNVEPEMAGRIQSLVIVHVLGAPEVTDQEREEVFNEAIQIVAGL